MDSKTLPNVQPGGADPTASFITSPAEVESVRARIVSFIRLAVEDADAGGVVVPMSGGIDSTLTAALAIEALGEGRVLGLGLPCHKTESVNAYDARTIAGGLGMEYREVQLRPLLDCFEDMVAPRLDPMGDRHAIGNVIARLRMTCAYYVANTRGDLVLGTANRSEHLLGYFTKYGDGGADLFPIGDLYKTEVGTVAHRIGLPKRIIGKEPTAGFWAGQTDADDLGAPYDVLDPILLRAVDRNDPPDRIAADVDVDPATVEELLDRCVASTHKRAVPPKPGIRDRSTPNRTPSG